MAVVYVSRRKPAASAMLITDGRIAEESSTVYRFDEYFKHLLNVDSSHEKWTH